MEKKLGCELFNRQSRPLKLTVEAQLLKQYLEQVHGDFNRFFSELRQSYAIKPILRVGILESLHLNVGVKIIEECLPQLSEMTVITASANVLMQRVVERKLDLIITNHGSMRPIDIFRIKLFQEPSILILPKDLAAQENGPWTWEKLQVCGYPLIRYWQETGAGEINELHLRKNNLQFASRLAVDTNALMVELVKRQMGWAFSRPTTILQNSHLLPYVAVRPMQPPVLNREVFLIGRQSEFKMEAQLIAQMVRGYVKDTLIPKIQEFAPWIEEEMKVSDV